VQGSKITDTTADVPGNWYATRISSRQSWIKSIINSSSASMAETATISDGMAAVPEPAGAALLRDGDIAPASSPPVKTGGRE